MSSDKVPSKRALAFKDWMAERGTNTKQVAEKSGVTYTTLASFVQGATRSLKGETEEKITAAYGCSAAEIFERTAPPVMVIPVISEVAAGKLTDPATQIRDGDQTIEIGGLDPGDYFATRVSGDSMDRLSPPGSLIVVNRADRDLVRGRRYIFSLRGKTTYKRWEVNPFRLVPESTNPANEAIFPKSEEEWTVIGRVRLTLMDDL